MKLKLRALKFLLFVLALLPAGCHYEFTGPALWAHNSSSAFETWLAMWVIALALPVGVWFLPLDSSPPQSDEGK